MRSLLECSLLPSKVPQIHIIWWPVLGWKLMLGDGWYLLDCFGNYHCLMAWLVSASAHRYCQPFPPFRLPAGTETLP